MLYVQDIMVKNQFASISYTLIRDMELNQLYKTEYHIVGSGVVRSEVICSEEKWYAQQW